MGTEVRMVGKKGVRFRAEDQPSFCGSRPLCETSIEAISLGRAGSSHPTNSLVRELRNIKGGEGGIRAYYSRGKKLRP